jgi:hypothetical protein
VVFSTTDDPLWNLQTIELFDSQVPEQLKVSIANCHAVESVNLFYEVFDAVDVVSYARKFKQMDDALGCPNELALECAKNDGH